MPAVKARSGKGGRVSIGSANLNLKTWSVTYRGDDLDTTNMESGGFETGTTGVKGCDISIEGDWDAGANPFDSPALYPQDALATVKLYTNVSDGVFWSFPVCRVISSENSAPVRGLVTFKATMKSNGTFVAPTGSV